MAKTIDLKNIDTLSFSDIFFRPDGEPDIREVGCINVLFEGAESQRAHTEARRLAEEALYADRKRAQLAMAPGKTDESLAELRRVGQRQMDLQGAAVAEWKKAVRLSVAYRRSLVGK